MHHNSAQINTCLFLLVWVNFLHQSRQLPKKQGEFDSLALISMLVSVSQQYLYTTFQLKVHKAVYAKLPPTMHSTSEL